MHYEPVASVPATGIPHTIFLNDCSGGCNVTSGNTDSRTDTSTIGSGSLSAFNGGSTKWNQIVACMKDVFSPFNVTITTTDPGTADHFEIMIAGTGSQLRLGSGVLGIAPFNCSQYIPYALSFAFANDPYAGSADEICATAAQEMAHTWSLDHTVIAADPLTYYPNSSRRHYYSGDEKCGSDCGQMSGSPYGQVQSLFSGGYMSCSGASYQSYGPQEHACQCGGATQNPVSTISSLFGSGTPTPPTVTITSPKNGDAVTAGFPVRSTIVDDSGVIAKAELRVDNVLVQTLTSSPFAFNAPATLSQGTHRVEVTGYDPSNTPGKSFIDVVIGKPCGSPSDCPTSNDTCVGGRCVPGPNATGGLGTVCMSNTDCASAQCGSAGSGAKYCVEACDPTQNQCPSGFGCLSAGNGQGVCWPGAGGGGGGGGCTSSDEPAGPIVFGLGFAALLIVRRRR
jgi:MYXO-CTERM domain-containing protein